MKFSMDNVDKNLLLASGAACAAYGVTSFSVPKKFHDAHYTIGQVGHAPSTRWMGAVLTCNSANQIVLSTSDDKKLIKTGLKVVGTGWLACAGLQVYNAQEKIQKRDISLGTAAAMATLGGICLYRGLRKEDSILAE